MFTRHQVDAIAAAGVLIVKAARDHQSQLCAAVLDHVGNTFGADGVYLLCNGIAGALRESMKIQPGMFHGFQIMDPQTGRAVSPDALDDERGRAVLHGMQFLMAYLNDEHTQKEALFQADPLGVSTGLIGVTAAIYDKQVISGRHRWWVLLRAFCRRIIRKARRMLP